MIYKVKDYARLVNKAFKAGYVTSEMLEHNDADSVTVAVAKYVLDHTDGNTFEYVDTDSDDFKFGGF